MCIISGIVAIGTAIAGAVAWAASAAASTAAAVGSAVGIGAGAVAGGGIGAGAGVGAGAVAGVGTFLGLTAGGWGSVASLGLGLAGTAISTGTSMYAQYQQGAAQAQMYDYQNALAEQNAQIAAMQQQNAANKAEIEKEELRRKVHLMRGEGRSNYAAGNVVLGEGSPVDWEVDIRQQEEYQRDKIDYNTRLQKWGYGVQGSNAMAQAGMYSAAASNSRRAGLLGATGSLISGATTMGRQTYGALTA